MKMLAIVLPDRCLAREALAMLEVVQRELVRTPDDACLVTRDPSGELRLRQSVTLTSRGASGTFWSTFVQRLLLVQKRQDAGIGIAGALRPGCTTLFAIARNPTTYKHLLVLANAVDARVLELELPRVAELTLQLAGMMPGRATAA